MQLITDRYKISSCKVYYYLSFKPHTKSSIDLYSQTEIDRQINMWDQRYNEPGFAYGTDENDFLRTQYSRIPKSGRVLCLAEGEGRNSVFLAKQGYQVTAVDQSAVGLEKAQQLAVKNGVTIKTEVANLNDYDLGQDSWHGVVSISAHLPPGIRKSLHANLSSALKNNGVLILEAYTEDNLQTSGIGGPPPSQKELFMSLAELKTELKDLKLEIAQELKRNISEGKYHQGESAVVQVVGYKLG